MKIYKCDGKAFHGGFKCSRESENDLPENWIQIDMKYSTKNEDSYVRQSSGLKHFCSKECFIAYFFKNQPDWKQLDREFKIYSAAKGNPTEAVDTLQLKKDFKVFCEERYDYCLEDISESLKTVIYLNEQEQDEYRKQIKDY